MGEQKQLNRNDKYKQSLSASDQAAYKKMTVQEQSALANKAHKAKVGNVVSGAASR